MNKPRLILDPKKVNETIKVILDTGSNISLINRKLLTEEMKSMIHNSKDIVEFPLLGIKESNVQDVNIQLGDDVYKFIVTDVEVVDVLIGNDILKESIIDQQKQLLILNNRRYRITYQKSKEYKCNLNTEEEEYINSKFEEDEDIKDKVIEIVENLPSTICDILVKTNPSEEEIEIITNFISEEFEDVIVEKLPEISDQLKKSRRNKIIHNILIKTGMEIKPAKKLIYYTSDDQKKVVEEMIEKFLDLGIITRSKSNYSSPIILIREESKWRIVHDYRNLNEVTVRDEHPFTPADNLISQCKDSKLFSKFDMIMGFFQVMLNPKHQQYTAFTTHIGKFEYLRMPMGLVNSPSTFARLMVETFGKIKNLLQYFDDLLIHTKENYKKHFIEIIRMLLYCRKYMIYIAKSKSHMFKKEVDFLGFQINQKGISPRAAKIRAITELPNPRTAKEAESALGLFGFFRRVIPKYAEKTAFISAESKVKGGKLSDKAIEEFIALKEEFKGDNIVAIPIEKNDDPVDMELLEEPHGLPVKDPDNIFNGGYHLYCDVSDLALSGVLYQIQESRLRPIWFHSRKLSETQKRYSIGDREFLSIVDSLKKFQYLLMGKRVTIYTDHQNLLYVINKTSEQLLSNRQINYIKYLEEFNAKLIHISGNKNGVADFLSRKYDSFQWDASFLEKIKEEQEGSEWLKEMKNNQNLCIEGTNDIYYLVEDGIRKLIIIEKETIDKIVREYHDAKYSGHKSFEVVYNNIRHDYYFRDMYSIIKRYIKSCAVCQLNINRKETGLLQSLEIPYEVWRDISMDFVSMPKSKMAMNGFQVEVDQCCMIVCRLSKMIHAIPCAKTINAEHTAQLMLNHVFRLHGYPRTIVSDRDPKFISEIWRLWAETMDSKLKMTVAHRAKGDGQTERKIQEFVAILTKMSSTYGEGWADLTALAEFAMNSSISKVTKMSPFQAVYGFNPPTPVSHFNTLTRTKIPLSSIKKNHT
ncbi:hypothetical protein RB653_010668 [Dictyostelium firmibasis]|uniref:RNA-directed DNA polymerase n=1 Tax=Dictyostelium firmibasis TaxID=79012 RepID=A0AAN7TRK7_9MYCE